MNISISEVQELKSIQCNVQVADSKGGGFLLNV